MRPFALTWPADHLQGLSGPSQGITAFSNPTGTPPPPAPLQPCKGQAASASLSTVDPLEICVKLVA